MMPRINGFGVLACIAIFSILFYFWTNSQNYKERRAEDLQIKHMEAIQNGVKLGENMQYFIDSEAKLCFGISQRSPEDHSITHVPCTEEVLERVKKGVKH